MMTEKVTLIGLGAMGVPMGARLLDAGIDIAGYDLSESARERFAQNGAATAPTLEEAVTKATVVILMLPNSEIVENVVSQIRCHLSEGTLLIDMSSSEPRRTRRLAEDLAPLALIDAPVSGGVKGAVAGTLMIMAGGKNEDVERARPLLSHLGTVKRAGHVGAGHAVKALNNLLSATHLWATSEAVRAGQEFDLDPAVMLDIFNGASGRSGSTENKWPNFVLTETYDSGFTLGLMHKDMRIAVSLTEEIGTPSRLGADAMRYWAEAEETLGPAADHTEIARWISERHHSR